MGKDPNEAARRRVAVLQELQPWAVKGKDTEYSAYLCETGLHFSEVNKDVPRAMEYFNLAYEYDPWYRKNLYYITLGYFHLGRMNTAFEYTDALTQTQYPNINRAYRVAIHIALEAGENQAAKNYCENYLNAKGPPDQVINGVLQALKGNNPASALQYFKNKRQ